MRRKDCQIKDNGEITKILKESDILRIALCDGAYPYIVPVNFAVNEKSDSENSLSIYIHGASKGRKLDIIEKNNNVCFEADRSFELVTSDECCQWSAKFESVIGFGEIHVVTDLDEKRQGLDLIMRKYGFKGDISYAENAFKQTMVIRIDVKEMTGKRK